MPSKMFTAIVLGTQVVALVLSVYGCVGDKTVEAIGWIKGIIIIVIALFTFILVDLIKVATIRLWNWKFGNNTVKTHTRAQKFQLEHRSELQW
jgi:H+-transporting ATPase